MTISRAVANIRSDRPAETRESPCQTSVMHVMR